MALLAHAHTVTAKSANSRAVSGHEGHESDVMEHGCLRGSLIYVLVKRNCALDVASK